MDRRHSIWPMPIPQGSMDVSLPIPVSGGQPALGTWQGIYLWEHRSRARRRRVVVTVWGG
jgi:thiamine phosphate synthase YjbQ (UPF0047 family)